MLHGIPFLSVRQDSPDEEQASKKIAKWGSEMSIDLLLFGGGGESVCDNSRARRSNTVAWCSPLRRQRRAQRELTFTVKKHF